mmetsp:Transcript_49261/g.145451  ORF Transcript_49261/g.145451 Transcript_49261/m.145451 type:complete len:211 (-) Transcript_49261:12-644(-)
MLLCIEGSAWESTKHHFAAPQPGMPQSSMYCESRGRQRKRKGLGRHPTRDAQSTATLLLAGGVRASGGAQLGRRGLAGLALRLGLLALDLVVLPGEAEPALLSLLEGLAPRLVLRHAELLVQELVQSREVVGSVGGKAEAGGEEAAHRTAPAADGAAGRGHEAGPTAEEQRAGRQRQAAQGAVPASTNGRHCRSKSGGGRVGTDRCLRRI